MRCFFANLPISDPFKRLQKKTVALCWGFQEEEEREKKIQSDYKVPMLRLLSLGSIKNGMEPYQLTSIPIENSFEKLTKSLDMKKYLQNEGVLDMFFWRFQISIQKIEWDRIPMDPDRSVSCDRDRAIRYSGFFRGPWTVGPVGDFLDLWFVFFWRCIFFEFCQRKTWDFLI